MRAWLLSGSKARTGCKIEGADRLPGGAHLHEARINDKLSLAGRAGCPFILAGFGRATDIVRTKWVGD